MRDGRIDGTKWVGGYMKNILVAMAMLSGLNAFAADGVNANSFTCQGPKKTEIGFTTTSFIGKPTLGVQFEGVEAKQSGEVTVVQTAIGMLATITDNHLAMVDGPTVRYSLVVPHVKVDAIGDGEKFDTVAIRTVVSNPFFRPTPSAGVGENNSFVKVECTAQAVAF
jgi:hypothetical protein